LDAARKERASNTDDYKSRHDKKGTLHSFIYSPVSMGLHAGEL